MQSRRHVPQAIQANPAASNAGKQSAVSNPGTICNTPSRQNLRQATQAQSAASNPGKIHGRQSRQILASQAKSEASNPGKIFCELSRQNLHQAMQREFAENNSGQLCRKQPNHKLQHAIQAKSAAGIPGKICSKQQASFMRPQRHSETNSNHHPPASAQLKSKPLSDRIACSSFSLSKAMLGYSLAEMAFNGIRKHPTK